MDYLNNLTYSSQTRTLTKTVGSTSSPVFVVDNTPTENSNNPITSGAVYTLIGDLDAVVTPQNS